MRQRSLKGILIACTVNFCAIPFIQIQSLNLIAWDLPLVANACNGRDERAGPPI